MCIRDRFSAECGILESGRWLRDESVGDKLGASFGLQVCVLWHHSNGSREDIIFGFEVKL